MTPLRLFHGEIDPRTPIEQARLYIDAARRHGRDHLIQATLYPNVGHPGHYGGLSEADDRRRVADCLDHLRRHAQAPVLPDAGRLVVAGFLVTRRFSVRLPSPDQVALLDYDLTRGDFRLRAPTCRTARLRRPGRDVAQDLACHPIGLQDFCDQAGVPHPDTYAPA